MKSSPGRESPQGWVANILMSLERPLAIAWKDMLVLGKASNAWRGAIGSLILFLPLVAFAALCVHLPGPWRFAARPVALGTAAIFSALGFLVAVPAAMSLALERDRDTLQGLIVSPASPRDLILGKLFAAVASSFVVKAVTVPALAFAYALGGLEAGFIPRFVVVLVATDVSFAAAAVYASARPLRVPRLGAQGVKIGISQAQLALQRSVGVVVLVSLVPIYTTLFAVPLAIQYGPRLGKVLEDVAAVGALHPLFALLVWGDVKLFGAHVPVWVLAVVFHGALAFPLVAGAADAQRPSGSPRGRATRVGFLVFFAIVVALATGATQEQPEDVRAAIAGGLASVLVVLGATGVSQAPAPRRPFGRSDVLRALVDPRETFRTSAVSAPGFALVLALVATPFVLHATPLAAGVRTCAALATAAIAIGLVGARLAARAQARDVAALERAIQKTREPGASGEPPAEAAESAEEPSTGAGTALGLAAVFVLTAPILSIVGIELAKKIGTLEPLVPVLRGLGILGIAANPFTCLEPLASGSSLAIPIQQASQLVLGIAPGTLYTLHVAFFAVLGALALATLARAREVVLTSPAPAHATAGQRTPAAPASPVTASSAATPPAPLLPPAGSGAPPDGPGQGPPTSLPLGQGLPAVTSPGPDATTLPDSVVPARIQPPASPGPTSLPPDAPPGAGPASPLG